MNKLITFLVMICSLSLVFVGSSAFAQQIETTVGWNPFEATWLIGYRVWSPVDQTYLGQITDFVIDQANGRIAMVVLSDVPGLGARHVAVPYSSLVRTGPNTFVLSFGDQEVGMTSGINAMDPYLYELTKAPSDSDLYGIPSVIDSNWVAEIYRHYGQVPYWTEKGGKPLAATEL